MSKGSEGATVDADLVKWAYRLLLEREPESDAVVKESVKSIRSLKELRERFLSSEEYCNRNAVLAPVRKSRALASPPEIDLRLSPNEVEELLRRVERVWGSLGESDPHWSVLTDDQYRSASIESSKDQFYASGREHLEVLKRTLARNGRDLMGFDSILEYGCGVGRVSHWFCREFDSVHCCDVSTGHLKLAREYVESNGFENATFHKISSVGDLGHLPQVELIMSYLVMQHNPTPVIEVLIERLLALLKSKGVALFQVPVFLEHYSFKMGSYMAGPLIVDDVEMHAVPQRRIFELIEGQDCKVLEVLDDGLVEESFGVSNTFLVEKR